MVPWSSGQDASLSRWNQGFDSPGHYQSSTLIFKGSGYFIDAAAALVGIPHGKHKVRSRFTDGKKSWEGSLAMLAVSFISGMIVLAAVRNMPLPRAVLSASAGALLGTATELFSPSEYDTVTVPAVIAAVLLLLG